MKKYTNYITDIAAIVVGVYLLLFPVLGSFFVKVNDGVESNGFLNFISFVVGLIVLVSAYLEWRKDRQEDGAKTITLHTESGVNTIAIDSIEGLLRDELAKEKDISEPRVSLSSKSDDKLKCKVRFKLNSQPDIPGRIESLKKMVKESFTKLIPAPQELEISCRVDSIILEGQEKKEEPKVQPQNNGGYFEGPVYPVPGEDAGDNEEF
jgi:small-conductance mechanosensitive channel